MQVSFVVLAIPFFLALIAIEQVITRRQGSRGLSVEDAVSNLGCGIVQQLVQLPVRTASFAAYLWVYGHLRLVSFPSTPWTWGLCFLGADFLAYGYHRMGHRVAVLWAAHEVHHQSEGLDLTVSLRVPALDYYYWAFDLPLALLGFPPGMFLAVSSFVSIYGFSSHTRTIGRLGPLEWLFVTPSHHRLHHASNREYLDRNYGKVLIVWDRIFGTFVKESEEPRYGLTVPLGSWNPLWANARAFVELARRVRSTARLRDRLRGLFLPPGWKPAGAYDSAPTSRPPAATLVPRIEAPRLYVTAQFLPAVVATIALLNLRRQLATPTFAACAVLVIATLATLGGLLDRRSWAGRAELLRVGVTATLALLIVPTSPRAAVLELVFSAAALLWLTSPGNRRACRGRWAAVLRHPAVVEAPRAARSDRSARVAVYERARRSA